MIILEVEIGVTLACLHSYFGMSFQRSCAMNHMINMVYQTVETSLVWVFIGVWVNKWECVNFFNFSLHNKCTQNRVLLRYTGDWMGNRMVARVCIYKMWVTWEEVLDKSFPLTLQLSTSNNRYTNSTTCSSSTPMSSPFLPAVAQKVTTKWEVAISNYLCPEYLRSELFNANEMFCHCDHPCASSRDFLS